MGGPAFTHASEGAACGLDYSTTNPTLRPVLVNMSRVTSPDKLGVQALNASLAIEEIGMRTAPSGAAGSVIAASVSSGEISPKPPNIAATAAQYGVSDPSWMVEVQDGGVTALSESWATVLARGALSGVEDGKTYAFIFVGPRPDLKAANWWNAPAITIAPTAP
jgi:hypothetical protein